MMFKEEKKTIYIDIPSGWRYGFPKAVPDKFVKDETIVDREGFDKWLESVSPKDTLIEYTRMWVE